MDLGLKMILVISCVARSWEDDVAGAFAGQP